MSFIQKSELHSSNLQVDQISEFFFTCNSNGLTHWYPRYWMIWSKCNLCIQTKSLGFKPHNQKKRIQLWVLKLDALIKWRNEWCVVFIHREWEVRKYNQKYLLLHGLHQGGVNRTRIVDLMSSCSYTKAPVEDSVWFDWRRLKPTL